MKELRVCIGSACHLKGAYDVIKTFQKLIEENTLEEEIELKAAFCLGHCTEAVSVKRWDGEILSVSINNAEEIFQSKIINEL